MSPVLRKHMHHKGHDHTFLLPQPHLRRHYYPRGWIVLSHQFFNREDGLENTNAIIFSIAKHSPVILSIIMKVNMIPTMPINTILCHQPSLINDVSI